MAIKFPGPYGNVQCDPETSVEGVQNGELAAFVGTSGRLTGGAGVMAGDVMSALAGGLMTAVYESIPIDDWYFGGAAAESAADTSKVGDVDYPAVRLATGKDVSLSIVLSLPEGTDFAGLTSGENPLALRLSGLIDGDDEGTIGATVNAALLSPWAAPVALVATNASVELDDDYSGRSVAMYSVMEAPEPGDGEEAVSFGPGCEIAISIQRATVEDGGADDADLLLTSAALLVPRIAVGAADYDNIPDQPVPEEGDDGGDDD